MSAVFCEPVINLRLFVVRGIVLDQVDPVAAPIDRGTRGGGMNGGGQTTRSRIPVSSHTLA